MINDWGCINNWVYDKWMKMYKSLSIWWQMTWYVYIPECMIDELVCINKKVYDKGMDMYK